MHLFKQNSNKFQAILSIRTRNEQSNPNSNNSYTGQSIDYLNVRKFPFYGQKFLLCKLYTTIWFCCKGTFTSSEKKKAMERRNSLLLVLKIFSQCNRIFLKRYPFRFLSVGVNSAII